MTNQIISGFKPVKGSWWPTNAKGTSLAPLKVSIERVS
jgi:hypothetical protein